MGINCGCARYGLVGGEVGTSTLGRVVLGGGDEDLARGGQPMGVPACGEHARSENPVDVRALADTEADPPVHLRAHRALAHGLPGRGNTTS
jgi:hypothetical protein